MCMRAAYAATSLNTYQMVQTGLSAARAALILGMPRTRLSKRCESGADLGHVRTLLQQQSIGLLFVRMPV